MRIHSFVDVISTDSNITSTTAIGHLEIDRDLFNGEIKTYAYNRSEAFADVKVSSEVQTLRKRIIDCLNSKKVIVFIDSRRNEIHTNNEDEFFLRLANNTGYKVISIKTEPNNEISNIVNNALPLPQVSNAQLNGRICTII